MAIVDQLVAMLGYEIEGEKNLKKFEKNLDKTQKSSGKTARNFSNTSSAIKGIVAGVGIANMLTKAMDLEEAMADVAKVSGGTSEQIDGLQSDLLKMAEQSGRSASELAEIAAEAAGAGVEFKDLASFTAQTMKAVVAFGMPAGEVGNIMVKLGAVFKMTTEEMGGFSDTANLLSNSVAAKASEILNFTNRASGAAKFLGLTVHELSAVGAAMVASGVIPETAASGITALATRIQTDAKGVNGTLKKMGLSTKIFQKMLAEDGDAALLELFQKLSKMDVSSQAEALSAFVGQDYSDDFSKFLANPDMLAKTFSLAADEAKRAGSVQAEYEARLSTTRTKLAQLNNVLTSISVIILDPVLDATKAFADFTLSVVNSIREMSGWKQSLAGAGAAITTALATLILFNPWTTIKMIGAALAEGFVWLRGITVAGAVAQWTAYYTRSMLMMTALGTKLSAAMGFLVANLFNPVAWIAAAALITAGLVAYFWDDLTAVDWGGLGSSIIQGIGNGIMSGVAWVQSLLTSLMPSWMMGNFQGNVSNVTSAANNNKPNTIPTGKGGSGQTVVSITQNVQKASDAPGAAATATAKAVGGNRAQIVAEPMLP